MSFKLLSIEFSLSTQLPYSHKNIKNNGCHQNLFDLNNLSAMLFPSSMDLQWFKIRKVNTVSNMYIKKTLFQPHVL